MLFSWDRVSIESTGSTVVYSPLSGNSQAEQFTIEQNDTTVVRLEFAGAGEEESIPIVRAKSRSRVSGVTEILEAG